MPYLRGGSLRQALTGEPWPERQTVRLLSQIGSALAYAHRQGVLHLDVRPSNVLLDEAGNAYLSDFGIASRPIITTGRLPSIITLDPDELIEIARAKLFRDFTPAECERFGIEDCGQE